MLVEPCDFLDLPMLTVKKIVRMITDDLSLDSIFEVLRRLEVLDDANVSRSSRDG